MQTQWFWFLFPFLLLISQITAMPEQEDTESEGEYYDASDSDLENQDESNTRLTNNSSFAGAALQSYYAFLSSGDERYQPYSFVGEKLFDLIKFADSLNPIDVLRCFPFVMLAFEQVKQNPQTNTNSKKSWNNMEMDQFSLASIMKSSKLFKKLCLKPERAKLLDNALKLIAGEEAYNAITALAEEAKKNITDIGDNKRGISGETLTKLAQNSKDFKKLFPTDDVAAYALNMINAQMSEYLSIETIEAADVLERIIPIQSEEDQEKSVEYMAKDTLRFSSQIFLEIAKKKIDLTLQTDQGKSTGLTGTLQRTRSKVLSKMTGVNYKKIVPQIASYNLPIGMGFNAFRFISLITYVSLVAHGKNANIPKLPEKAATITGFDTDNIINAMINSDLMKKINLEDPNSTSTTILKFTARPEADLLEIIVTKLKEIASSLEINLDDLDITDVIENSDLMAMFLSLDEFTSVTIRSLSSQFYSDVITSK